MDKGNELMTVLSEVLPIISIVSFVLAGVALLVAVVLFIKFKIPSVIGDLSGRTARKSIAQVREYNEKSGKKAHSSSPVNQNRGKVTDAMPQPKPTKAETKEQKKAAKKAAKKAQTGVLKDNKAQKINSEETELLENNVRRPVFDDNATAPLNETAPLHTLDTDVTGEETAPLNETAPLYTQDTDVTGEETTALNETSLLGSEEAVEKPSFVPKKELSSLDDVMMIHTSEVIE